MSTESELERIREEQVSLNGTAHFNVVSYTLSIAIAALNGEATVEEGAQHFWEEAISTVTNSERIHRTS